MVSHFGLPRWAVSHSSFIPCAVDPSVVVWRPEQPVSRRRAVTRREVLGTQHSRFAVGWGVADQMRQQTMNADAKKKTDQKAHA
jgi:hypothetical protein